MNTSVEALRHPAATNEIALQIEGMTCASCVARVEKALLVQQLRIAGNARRHGRRSDGPKQPRTATA